MIWFWEKQRSPVGWWQKLILGLAGLLAVLWTDRKCQPPHLPVWHPSLLPCLFTTSISGQLGQSYGFSSGHVWMWELDYKESWVLKKWCFWTVVLEKTLESPLNCKEIQPVHPKGDQTWIFIVLSWIFIGRTDVEAETSILWLPDVKSWLTGKDPDAGKDWRQEEKEMTEDEMAGWHYQLNGHEFE